LLIKIFAWWYTGSVSILAALVDSLMDIAASLTNLLVVRYSLQPADEEHTFGHGKAESLAALAQSMFISGSALFLFLTGIQHLVSPTPMNDPGVGVVVTVLHLYAHWFWLRSSVGWFAKRKVRLYGRICFIISLML
jgi:ferrous-iron efflux pump FieF